MLKIHQTLAPNGDPKGAAYTLNVVDLFVFGVCSLFVSNCLQAE